MLWMELFYKLLVIMLSASASDVSLPTNLLFSNYLSIQLTHKNII